ncbi:MAG: hypothetical protein Q8P84_06010, partial [Deltaproteobacteria bacterium]|nr:hypothetical protein [Deltaproteobacteria bacterium]
IPDAPSQEIKKKVTGLAQEQFQKLDAVQRRSQPLKIEERLAQPHLAVRIEEEKTKKIPARADAALKQGGHFCVVPFSFRHFHEDRWSAGELEQPAKHLKPEQTVWGTAGLNLPEQAVFALSKGFHSVLLDGWSLALKGQVDPKRALVDLSFAFSLCGRFKSFVLNDHSIPEMPPHRLLAYLLLYEQHAKRQGIEFKKIMLEYFPKNLEKMKGPFAQIALAQIIREAFSQSLLWMGLENKADPFLPWIAAFTEQDVLELKNPDEALMKAAKAILNETEGFADEFSLNTYGKIAREAHQILDQSWKYLKELQHLTLWKAFEQEGKKAGGEAVFQKSFHYLNPVAVILSAREESRGSFG